MPSDLDVTLEPMTVGFAPDVADQRVGAVFIFNTETRDVQMIRNGIEAH